MHKYWTSAADSAMHQGQLHDPRADEDTFIDSTHLPSYSAAAWRSELGTCFNRLSSANVLWQATCMVRWRLVNSRQVALGGF